MKRLLERIDREILAAGGKRSRSRAIVIEGFFRARDHLTIEELTRSVRESAPGIGAVTVYRTLKLLERLGYAIELDFGEGARRYESNLSPHHDHLVCRQCGTVIEFEDRKIQNLRGPRDPTARVPPDGAPSRNLRVLQKMRFRQISGARSMNIATIPLEPLGAVILVGNPNVGKSVVFGALTGRYVNVSNYPGTTVEITRGEARDRGTTLEVIDTPGVYSLLPMSEDERVTRDILMREPGARVLQVCDAKNMRRSLMITAQLAEMEVPLVLAVNMTDEARERGVMPRLETLENVSGFRQYRRWRCGKRGRIASSLSSNTRPRPRYGSTTETGSRRPSFGWKGCFRRGRRSGRERWRSCCCAATTPSLRGSRRASPPSGSGR